MRKKKKLTTKDLLDKFKVTSGEEFDNDRVLLSTEAGSKPIKQNKRRNRVERFRLFALFYRVTPSLKMAISR